MKYGRTIEVCGLGADIDLLPEKDATVIGDQVSEITRRCSQCYRALISLSGHQLEWRSEAESESGKGCVSRQWHLPPGWPSQCCRLLHWKTHLWQSPWTTRNAENQGTCNRLKKKKSKREKKKVTDDRCGQDLNLCGETPMDFKSIALTTRPPQLLSGSRFSLAGCHVQRCWSKFTYLATVLMCYSWN